jgi:N4-gp56 family major capsid protein
MTTHLTWADDGSFYYSEELSDILRTNLQPLTKFRQFADVKDASQKGLHRGDKFRWNRYGDLGTQGRSLAENQEIPQTNFSVDQAELTITEYGNSVPYTGKLEKLAKHDVIDLVKKALANDARKAFDIAAYLQFDATPCLITPTSGTATDAVTLTTNGTASATNNVAMGADHLKAIADMLEELNVPPYRGDDYMLLSHPTTLRPVKNDLEALNQYTESGIGRIFRGEIGKYEEIRAVTQNQIPKGGAQDSTTFDPYTRTADAWNNAKSGWAYFFGADTVMEAMVQPEEIRAKIPGDYGRSKGIAWYYLGGFGIVHDGQDDAAQCRIYKWESLT